MLDKKLLRTQDALLTAVKTAQAPVNVRKVLYKLIKRFNFQKAHYDWQYNGFQDEGFQYLIIDGVKKEATKILKNYDANELEQLISDIVFAEIHA